MPSTNQDEPKRRSFSVDDANKALTYVQPVVSDIVRQIEVVNQLKARLSAVLSGRKKPLGDVYNEELAQSQSELELESQKLSEYIDELARTGVELKGPDGLCDFPSTRDGRAIYLCWRLGEPTVSHWHEIDAGFSGRQPLDPIHAGTGSKSGF